MSKALDTAQLVNGNKALLDAVKEIDGAGSGLDADYVRGLPSDFSNSIDTNGYQVLPSGLIIQWGSYQNGTGDSSNWAQVTFPIAFPNAVFSISESSNKKDTDSANYYVVEKAENRTLSGTQIAFINTDGNAHSATDDYVDVIVIGY